MAGPDGKTYRLETFVDVWNLGDSERIQRALSEICVGMVEARLMSDAILATARALDPSMDYAEPSGPWPRVLDWKDDGKGEITIRFHGGGVHLFDQKITLPKDDGEAI